MLLFLPNFKIDAWRKNPVESARFFPEILCSRTVYQGVPPRSDHHLRTDARASPPPRKPGRGQRPTGAGEGIQLPRAEEKNESGRATAQTAEQRSNHTPPPPARTAHPGEGAAAARQGARGKTRGERSAAREPEHRAPQTPRRARSTAKRAP